VICAQGVTVRAGASTLVDAVDLDIADGELVAIVGPNGAGKSTLLGALSGDRKIASGRVTLAGTNVHTASPARLARLRAVLPQRSSLTLAFTATEVVCLGHRAVGAPLARQHLRSVELAAFADRTYPSLSGGEQQRVQLARVLAQLAHHPGAAMLLDEPTSALDPRHQQLVLSLAREAATRGHAVAVVLHDLTLAARWADRIALLARGMLLASGAPSAVMDPALLATAYATPFEVLQGTGGMVITPRGSPA